MGGKMPKKLIVPGKKLPGLLKPAGPIKPDLDIKLPPGVLVQSVVSSLFQPGRPGKPAVRPDDLLAVRFELVNLQVQAGTPPKVVDFLHKEIARVVKTPEMQAKLTDLGLTPLNESPAQFQQLIDREQTKWSGVIKQANIKLD